jgi:regulator of replication initiation timing
MSEPDIQIQRDYPQTLVNSQWVKWAAERIAELEQRLAVEEAHSEKYMVENKALREENQDLRLHLITALVPDGYDTKTWESWLGKISQKNS